MTERKKFERISIVFNRPDVSSIISNVLANAANGTLINNKKKDKILIAFQYLIEIMK